MQICEAFGANRYPLPEEPNRQRAMAAEVRGRLAEMRTTLEVGDVQRNRLIHRVAAGEHVWGHMGEREKSSSLLIMWCTQRVVGDQVS